MKTVYTTSLYLLILFGLPLIGQPQLLTHPRIVLSAIVIVLLLVSQPPMKITEGISNCKTDNGTMFLILLVSSLGHIAAILDWIYLPSVAIEGSSIIGAILMVFGITFRIIAIRMLKYGFSSTVQIKENQELYTRGVYSKLRHPSYTGAWILMVGNALLFQSWIGLAILGIGMFFVYMKRIKVEEEVLADAFGKAYKRYQKRTWKFLPGY